MQPFFFCCETADTAVPRADEKWRAPACKNPAEPLLRAAAGPPLERGIRRGDGVEGVRRRRLPSSGAKEGRAAPAVPAGVTAMFPGFFPALERKGCVALFLKPCPPPAEPPAEAACSTFSVEGFTPDAGGLGVPNGGLRVAAYRTRDGRAHARDAGMLRPDAPRSPASRFNSAARDAGTLHCSGQPGTCHRQGRRAEPSTQDAAAAHSDHPEIHVAALCAWWTTGLRTCEHAGGTPSAPRAHASRASQGPTYGHATCGHRELPES
jgi:hypothetical protein